MLCLGNLMMGYFARMQIVHVFMVMGHLPPISSHVLFIFKFYAIL